MKRIKRELKYKGSIMEVFADTIELPNGKQVVWDYVNHNGAAAVIPVLEDGRILMVKQYRNALDRITLEIPAGKKDDKEELGLVCAMRELEEETGYTTDNIEWLIRVASWVAFTNELIEIYVAQDLKPTKQNLDEDEFLDVEAYELEELVSMIFTGEIEDSKTIAGLLAYQNKYLKK